MVNLRDEQQLIEKCKAGESRAQKAIYEFYAPVMLTLCIRYAGDRETAKDILQEGFIKIFNNIDSFSGIGNFGGWVRRIFVNTSLEYLRHNAHWNLTETIDNHLYSISDNETDSVKRLSANELMACITKLPKTDRAIFNLFAIEGYSHKEIADLLHITESTSRTLFSKARKKLREMVEKLDK